MATPGMLINLFPVAPAVLPAVAATALVTGLLLVLGTIASRWARGRRREAVTELARARGLSEPSAEFLGCLFQREGVETAEFQVQNPELLRSHLGRGIVHRRSAETASRYAERAGLLLGELGLRKAAFEGAPRPFDQLVLRDAADPTARSVPAWVVSADERNLTIISRQSCPWPLRRSLLVSPLSGGEPFSGALLLRPVPPSFEWVLTHDLVDVITNRRAAVRVPCRLQTFCLPDSGDPLLLRERLHRDETLEAEAVRRSRSWSQRHGVTVLDLSADGARLAVEHEVALHQRLHLLLTAEDGTLAGLPLAEIVSLTHGEDGVVQVGTRFIGVRLKERVRLAALVRSLVSRPAVEL